MRTINFAKRNLKELIRDPLSIVFSIILPIFLLYIFQQFKIPNESYKLQNFTPGIIVFSLSFITMFVSILVAKDRTTSLLIRLGVSPMKPVEFIMGYIISTIPIIIIESILIYVISIILGLEFSLYIIVSIFIVAIIAILFISLGILIGSICTEKSASGVSSIIVQLVCFTSGMYFSKDMLGDGFRIICEYLPFESVVTLIRGISSNNVSIITPRNIIIVVMYTVITFILSTYLFNKNMLSDNK